MKSLILCSIFFCAFISSGCSSLYHKNTWNGRSLSYENPPINCSGTIPVVVHWGAGWHTSIVIQNKNMKVSQYFNNFPFLEVNWGDKGFYKAGASQWKQLMAAPKAMLIPSSSVMYFVGIPIKKQQWCEKYDKLIDLSETDILLLSKTPKENINICTSLRVDYEVLFRYFDGIQIWVTPDDFSALTKKINEKLKMNSEGNSSEGNSLDLGNGYLFDSAYSTAARFFASNSSYYGLTQTCNTWTAEILGEINAIKTIKNSKIYRAESIFQFLQKEIKKGNPCVRDF